MIGFGYTPEGLPDTYITTDLLFEMSWRKTSIKNTEKWVDNYITRRYGKYDTSLASSWNLLFKSQVLNNTGWFPNRQILIAHLPSLSLTDATEYQYPLIIRAWKSFLCTSNQFKDEETFLYDLVDMTRQALVVIAPPLYRTMIKSYHEKKILDFIENSKIFMEIFDDLEHILGSSKHFLLGTWLEGAKAVANGNKNDEALYEFNARNQITLWGNNGEILDYAAKQWSGLIVDYYALRWNEFINELHACLIKGTPFSQAEFEEKFINNIGRPFTASRKTYPTKPSGDSISIAKNIYSKWIGSLKC